MITKQDWRQHVDFSELIESKAKKGYTYPFEVDEEIYTEFLEVLPPEEWGKERKAINVSLECWGLKSNLKEYFLVGEASSTVNGVNVYNSFIELENGKYFYIGLLPTIKSMDKKNKSL